MSNDECVCERSHEPLHSETVDTIGVCAYNASIPYTFWCPLGLNVRQDQNVVLGRDSIVIGDLLYQGADFSEIVEL